MSVKPQNTFLGLHHSTCEISGKEMNTELEKLVNMKLLRTVKIKPNCQELRKDIVIIEWIGDK